MAGPGTLLMGLGIAYGLATRWKIYSISSIRVTWMSRPGQGVNSTPLPLFSPGITIKGALTVRFSDLTLL